MVHVLLVAVAQIELVALTRLHPRPAKLLLKVLPRRSQYWSSNVSEDQYCDLRQLMHHEAANSNQRSPKLRITMQDSA